MSRFFVNASQVGDSSILVTDKDDIKHMLKVLRLKEGDEIDISDGQKYEYIAQIALISDSSVECTILDKQNFAREPELEVTLFQGIPKQGKMEVIIQKTVEMGIKAIVPVFTARTVVEDSKGKFDKKIERWQKVSDEAVKQCKRGLIPPIESAIAFKEMIKELTGDSNSVINGAFDLVIFPYENEENISMKDLLSDLDALPSRVAIIIGPEGGFSDEEARIMSDIGAKSASLGKTILRTETAGIVALAMTMYALEL